MLEQNFYEDGVMQTLNILLWINVLFVYRKNQNSHWIGNFLPFEKCGEH